MNPTDDLRDFEGITSLFPLRGVVLFPHAIIPLHIFEPRYRQMTDDALRSDQRITLVQSRPSLEMAAVDRPPLVDVGCLGRILQHERLPDGRFNFLLLGVRRIRIVRELHVDTLYRQAEVQVLEDQAPSPGSLLLNIELLRQFQRVVTLDDDWLAMLKAQQNLGVMTDLIAHAFPFPAELKQSLLCNLDPDHRAKALIELFSGMSAPADRPTNQERGAPPPFSLN